MSIQEAMVQQVLNEGDLRLATLQETEASIITDIKRFAEAGLLSCTEDVDEDELTTIIAFSAMRRELEDIERSGS